MSFLAAGDKNRFSCWNTVVE